MDPVSATQDSMQVVVASLVGLTGTEVHGGAADGALDPLLVVAQLGLVSIRELAAGQQTETRVAHIALTPETAVEFAEKLRASAEKMRR